MNFWEQVGAVLAECKREGLPFDGEDGAWFKAMRSIFPERKTATPKVVRLELAKERDLLRECKPFFRASYENREVTVEEFEAASVRTEKRLDALLAAA